MEPICAIVGLGNPGPRYAGTRHNAGFWFADELARRLGASFRDERKLEGAVAASGAGAGRILLFKPATYMNESGRPVGAFARYYRVPTGQLLVAYDDLDLAPGDVRLKRGGGHGGHNGLRDLYRHLPETGFARLRLGIGHPGHRDQVTAHVLSRPSAEDERAIHSAIERALEVMPLVLAGEWNRAVKSLHSAAT